MQRLHLRNLLKEATRLCDSVSTERPADDDPALTVLIANLGTLSSRLRDIAALAEQIGLPDVSRRMCEYGSRLDDFFGRIVLPIMARGETQEGLAALLERYGPFPQNVGNEYHEAEWIQIHGTLAHIRDCINLLQRSLKPKRKRGKESKPKASVARNGQSAPPESAKYLTVQDAAEKYQLGERTIYRMVEDGLPVKRAGRAIRIRPRDLEKWLEDSETILR